MTLLELNENYYFHDSVLEKIEFINNDLKLHCQFCNFMQENYNNEDDANSDIIVVFHNAVYAMDGDWENEASFLNQRIQDDSIVFFMESSPVKFGNLIINADSVDVIMLSSYNL